MHMLLRRIHRSSAVIIMIFALLHISNHLFAISGVADHIAVMNSLRVIYRNPFVEILLLGAVVAQIVTGLRLFWTGRNQRSSFFDWVQAFSGLYLAFFLVIHVSAVLVERNVFRLDSNFYFAAAGLLRFPLFLFFVPYYFLSVAAIFTHLGCGLRRAMMARRAEGLGSRMAYLMMLMGIIFAGLIVAIFSGLFYEIVLPTEYRL
jgi:succinate dehydrogenase/fumarate reductase cytochrome b subunit